MFSKTAFHFQASNTTHHLRNSTCAVLKFPKNQAFNFKAGADQSVFITVNV